MQFLINSKLVYLVRAHTHTKSHISVTTTTAEDSLASTAFTLWAIQDIFSRCSPFEVWQ